MPPSPTVTLTLPTWQKINHPDGYWQFQFWDGGVLTWRSDQDGALQLAGSPELESVKTLTAKVAGKKHPPGKGISGIEAALRKYFPETIRLEIPMVSSIGWRSRETTQSVQVDFSDGSQLYYDLAQARLDSRPGQSPQVQQALNALPRGYGAGSAALLELLKQVFPDWATGFAPLAETGAPDESAAGDSRLEWRRFWPANRAMRQAAQANAPGQAALMADWAAVLASPRPNRHVLAHAPTGLGKTVAALAPALAWVAQAPAQRQLFYLVNRVTQHHNPVRELQSGLAAIFAAETGQPLRVVDLVGRRLLCAHPEARLLNDFCRRSRQNASFESLPAGVLSWEAVKAHLGERACPYHTLQGLMPQAHVVIADYWWFFSEQSRPGQFRQAFKPARTILVVDEAHNLPLRVRSELDVELSFSEVRARLPQLPAPVQHYLTALLTWLQQLDPETGLVPSEIRARLGEATALQAEPAAGRLADTPDEDLSWLERIGHLLSRPDEAVVIYRAEDEVNGSRLVLRLVDPTPVLQAGYERAYASLSMSGSLAAPTDTASEMRYLSPQFGLPLDKTLARKYASPFSMRQQYWLCNADTYGAYQARARYLDRYADHIAAVGQATPGVTAIFFSSYEFLTQVQERLPEAPLVVAESRDDAEGRLDLGPGLSGYEAQLRQRVEAHGRAYLLAVYKGKLSEGASFNDNLIKSVICISVPLEYPGLYHQRLEEHYQRLFAGLAAELGDNLSEKAREYALERPSLSLVLQACGRGIRHQNDTCAFLLLDKRYTSPAWRRFLPSGPYNLSQPAATIKSFFRPLPPADEAAWDPAILAACQPLANQPTGDA